MREWYDEAKGNGFAMLLIMHTYMVENLVGDQAQIIVQYALHEIL